MLLLHNIFAVPWLMEPFEVGPTEVLFSHLLSDNLMAKISNQNGKRSKMDLARRDIDINIDGTLKFCDHSYRCLS